MCENIVFKKRLIIIIEVFMIHIYTILCKLLHYGTYLDVTKNQKRLFLLTGGFYQNSENSFELLKSQLTTPKF